RLQHPLLPRSNASIQFCKGLPFGGLSICSGYNQPMIHEIFPVGPLQCNCSVIGDPATHEAIVIDPGDDIERVIAALDKHKITVKQIVITHAHIDHVGGAVKLKKLTGAPILMNQNDVALLKMLDVQAAG